MVTSWPSCASSPAHASPAGTAADDRATKAARRGDVGHAAPVDLAGQVRVAQEALQPADGDGLTLLGEHARRLALLLLRAHAPADGGQRVALLEHGDTAGQVALDDRADERLDVDVDRAALLADGVAALQAALGFREGHLGGVAVADLVEAHAPLGGRALRHGRARRLRGTASLGGCRGLARRVGCGVVYRWHWHPWVYSESARRSSSA